MGSLFFGSPSSLSPNQLPWYGSPAVHGGENVTDLFDAHLENITLMEDRGTYSALVKPDPAQMRKYLEEMPL